MCARETHYDAVRVIQSQGDKRPGLGWCAVERRWDGYGWNFKSIMHQT